MRTICSLSCPCLGWGGRGGCVCVCVHACVCVCVRVRVCVCVCVCVYTYTILECACACLCMHSYVHIESAHVRAHASDPSVECIRLIYGGTRRQRIVQNTTPYTRKLGSPPQDERLAEQLEPVWNRLVCHICKRHGVPLTRPPARGRARGNGVRGRERAWNALIAVVLTHASHMSTLIQQQSRDTLR